MILSNDFNESLVLLIKESLKKIEMQEKTNKILFKDFALNWLDIKCSVISYSTFKGYKASLNSILNYFTNKNINDIKTGDIAAYIAYLHNKKLSAKTIKNQISVISSIYNSAIADNIINKNPCSNIRLPRGIKKETEPFTFNEVKEIMQEISNSFPDMALFFALGFFGGLRTGEILGLQYEDIDIKNNRIKICRTLSNGKLKDGTKTYKTRYIPILPVLLLYISRHVRKNDIWPFISIRGVNFKSYTAVTKYYWKPALKKSGIKYRNLYSMRHTFTVLMLESGEDINFIKNMLGHTNIGMIINFYGNRYNNKFGGTKFSNAF